MRLQTCHRLAGEGSTDEVTQGKIGNLLGGEVGLFHRRRNLQVWMFFEILDALIDHIWIDRTWPDYSG